MMRNNFLTTLQAKLFPQDTVSFSSPAEASCNNLFQRCYQEEAAKTGTVSTFIRLDSKFVGLHTPSNTFPLRVSVASFGTGRGRFLSGGIRVQTLFG
jgi:hypothetical protein